MRLMESARTSVRVIATGLDTIRRPNDPTTAVTMQAAQRGVTARAIVTAGEDDLAALALGVAYPNVEARHLATPTPIRCLITDEQELIAWTVVDPSACGNAPGDVALYTNAESFDGAQVAMFDALWASRARPPRRRHARRLHAAAGGPGGRRLNLGHHRRAILLWKDWQAPSWRHLWSFDVMLSTSGPHENGFAQRASCSTDASAERENTKPWRGAQRPRNPSANPARWLQDSDSNPRTRRLGVCRAGRESRRRLDVFRPFGSHLWALIAYAARRRMRRRFKRRTRCRGG